MIKNIIKSQNEKLLKDIAVHIGKDESYMIEKYLKPEYYLPIIYAKRKFDSGIR
jgi:hypothetical protein